MGISEQQLRELVQLAQKRSAVFDIVSDPFRFRWNLRTIHKRGFPWSNRQKKDATKGFLAVRRLSGGISTIRKNSTPELNYSRNGVCFECSRAPINGATIQVRLEAYHAECGSECRNNDECPWPRSISLGEVEWCLGLPAIGAQRFGVGVKFHLPI